MRRGCQSCRSRHVKCVIQAGFDVCTRCEEGGRSCVFDSRYRFKAVDHVFTASQGLRSRTNLVYDDDQTWVPTKEALGFILEDGAGAEYGTADFIERDERLNEGAEICDPQQPEAELVNSPNASVIMIEPPQADMEDQTYEEEDESTLGRSIASNSRESSLAVAAWQANSDEQQQPGGASYHIDEVTKNSTQTSAVFEDYTSPASLSDLTRRHESGHCLTWDTGEYGFLIGDKAQYSPPVEANRASDNMDVVSMILSRREAFLMQYFIQKLAPWMDCCDHACHFAQEVPRRAVRIPVLLYAVLAVSSRHQSLMARIEALEASYYYGRCLELMVSKLSMPDSYDDNLFATVVCLRVYEELDDKVDGCLHLQGIGRLLGAIPTFAHSGGLAEAASWQALRQDIYIAIRNKAQPSFDLVNYGLSKAFDFRDDGACANVVILLFGRLLRLLHSPPGISIDDALKEIEHHVKLWDVQRSRIFQPLFVKEANINENQPFPIVRLVNPAQVVALQYYNACLVLIWQHKLLDRTLHGFEAVKEQRNVERYLIKALGNVVGLAESNAWVENAYFTAHHMLRNSGYHITNLRQRKHSIGFLCHVQNIMGFNTQSTIDLLRSQWRDLD